MFRTIRTLHNLCLLTQCLLFRSHVSGVVKYCILRKTHSRHIKCANSRPPTQTPEIIHLLVLTTGSEYWLPGNTSGY